MLLLLLLACGSTDAATPLPYQIFPSSEAAFEAVLAENPTVLGIGEVHATTDGPAIPTTISRFTERLLPILAHRMTDLVIETWRLDHACGAQGEQVVATVQADTKRPEETKDEIVVLAEKAKALGIQPHDLTLSCEEYAAIQAKDGSVDYDQLLGMLTAKLGDYAQRGLTTPGASVVIYGGAMHNDLFPSDALAPYSYGVAARNTGGARYVELDLYAPELIRGKTSLLEPGWAPLLDGVVGPDRAVLYTRGPQSYVLFLETVANGAPPTGAPAPATPPPAPPP